MKKGVTREQLVSSIKVELESLIKEPVRLENIGSQLFERHDIPKSLILEMTNNNTDFSNISIIELALAGHYTALELGKDENWIQNYFTKNEMVRLRTYKRIKDMEEVANTFKPAIKVSDKVYYIVVHYRDIAKWRDMGTFVWDERVQREGDKKNLKDKIIVLPKLNQSNVKEIKEQALKGILMENELAYNLVEGSSSEGRELYFDEKNFSLTFAGDFLGHIVDGYHRTNGIYQAWLENPNIEGYMPIRISNYDIEESARYQVELSKATPLDKSRIRMLDKSRITDKVVDKLQVDGFLRGRISDKSTPNKTLKELVSYRTLSDALFNTFGKEDNPKILSITKGFQEYLEYLFEIYSDKYMDNRDSLLFRNYGFYLHVIVFKYMYDNGIPMDNLENILKAEYFSVQNIKDKYGYDITIQMDSKIKSKTYGLKLMEDMLKG